MKSLKIITLSLTVLSGLLLTSCTYPTYVTDVHTIQPKPAPIIKKPKPKPKPKPVETAEGFRAVEKPATYSN